MTVSERNNVHVNGQGDESMVFVHGFGCDQTMWRFVEPEFRSRFQTIAYDLTGCGQSARGEYSFRRHATLHGHVEDLLEIVNELDLKSVTFVGHSVSAMIGMLAAIKEPGRFRRLVMAGPSPCYINDADYVGGFSRKEVDSLLDTLDLNYLGWANSMAPAIMGNFERPNLGQELVTSFCNNDPKIAGHLARVTFLSDHRKDLPLCDTATLILQCSEDIIAPVAVGEYMNRQMPHNQLVVMKATGHCPNLSAPAETISYMRSFLATS